MLGICQIKGVVRMGRPAGGMAIEMLRTGLDARAGFPRRLVLVSALVVAWPVDTLEAQTAGPRLFFTDIESGPKTGDQNNLGAFIPAGGIP